jgi:hypothetical protein
MGSTQSSNVSNISAQTMKTAVSSERPLVKNRYGKWVRFSGSDEELANIALHHARYNRARLSCRPQLTQIKTAMSRRNGFNGQELRDTNCEHWCWSSNEPYDDKVALQAVNCRICGEYKLVSRTDFPLIDRIRCCCAVEDTASPAL